MSAPRKIDRKTFTAYDAGLRFLVTLCVAVAVMIAVLALAYQNQANDPASVREVCTPGTVCPDAGAPYQVNIEVGK